MIWHVQNRYTSEQLEGKPRSINMRTDDNLGVSAISNLDSNLTEREADVFPLVVQWYTRFADKETWGYLEISTKQTTFIS
jgi:hypothetical protein